MVFFSGPLQTATTPNGRFLNSEAAVRAANRQFTAMANQTAPAYLPRTYSFRVRMHDPPMPGDTQRIKDYPLVLQNWERNTSLGRIFVSNNTL